MVATQVNGQSGAVQPIGSALIVYGTVNAESAQGVTRTLQPNSPIFANDRIITGSDGMISIVFGDAARTQLDLGRMSDTIIDEDVFPGDIPVDIVEATADVEQIQQALLEGEFDPTQDLEAPAAGPGAGAASDGGGLSSVRFILTAEEVTPDSGAETKGIGYDFLDPDPPVLELAIPPEIPVAPTPAPTPTTTLPEDDIIIPPPTPTVSSVNRVVEEEAMDSDGTTGLGSIALVGTDSTTVQLWTIEHDGGWLNIDMLSEYGPGNYTDTGTGPFTDLDNDPSQVEVDLEIYLFDAGGNIVGWSDDSFGPQDGSVNTADSFITGLFPSGTYTLAVGSYQMNPFDAVTGLSDRLSDFLFNNWGPAGPYQLRVTGDGTPEVTNPPDGGYITSVPSLSDGNQDQDDGPEDSFQPDSAVLTGNLNSLVTNAPGASFGIQKPDGLPNLSSQGEPIVYELDGTTLEAWVRYGSPTSSGVPTSTAFAEVDQAEDRLIFSLDIQPNGDYKFILHDQLDHVPPPEGVAAEENIELLVAGGAGVPITAINLGGAIIGTYTGGSLPFVPTSLSFTIVDDIPILLDSFQGDVSSTADFNGQYPHPMAGFYVDEDALSNDYSATAPPGTSNYSNNNDPDDTTGNLDYGGYFDRSYDTDAWSTHLSWMVKPGSDEPLTWALDFEPQEPVDDSTELPGIVNESGLTSQGEEIYYRLEQGATEDKLIAFTKSNDNIFEFTVVKSTGEATFNLNGQLDHPDGSGDFATLTISDLGRFVRAMDFDKDYVTLDNHIEVFVENDVPEVIETGQYLFISEYAGYDNAAGIYQVDEAGNPIADSFQIVLPSSNIGHWSQVNPNGNYADRNPYSYDSSGNEANGPFHYTPGFNLGEYPEGTKMFLIADADKEFGVDTEFTFENGVLKLSDGTPVNDVKGVKGVFFMDSEYDVPGPPSTGWVGDTHFTDQWAESPEPERFIDDSPEFGGEVRIEDLNFGDKDFDDTVFRIEKGPVVSEAALTETDLDADQGSQTGADDLGTGTDPWGPHNTTMATGNFFFDENNTAAGIQFKVGADEDLTLDIKAMGITTVFEDKSVGPDGADSSTHTTVENFTISKDADGSQSVTLYGDAGTFTIYNDGEWTYHLTDNTLNHEDNDKGSQDRHDGDYDRYAADQVQEVFKITATDFDGDEVTANFIVNINDDGPAIGDPQDSIIANGPSSKQVGDTATAAVLVSSMPPVAINSLTADLSIDFGADGPGSVTLDLIENSAVTTVADHALRLKNSNLELVWTQNTENGSWSAVADIENPDGLDIRIPAFTISVDEVMGTYKVDLYQPVEEFDPPDPDQEPIPANFDVRCCPPEEENPTIAIGFAVTDGDGDKAISEDKLSITFDEIDHCSDVNIIDAVAADAADGDISTEGMVISGSSGDDIIIGTDYDDTADGGGGDDIIDGGIGNDALFGKEGNDTLIGDIGDDQLIGGYGEDTLEGNEGDDDLVGDEIIFNDSGNNIVDDGNDDTVYGGDDTADTSTADAGADAPDTGGSTDIDFGVEEDLDIDTLIPPPDAV